jgi:cytoskeletal protein CcmA (bactofilin family)
MWKPTNSSSPSTPTPEPQRPSAPVSPVVEPRASYGGGSSYNGGGSSAAMSNDQATLGKSLVIKGEVTGSESLYIDGRVEGTINLAGNRVTIGKNGQVAANITAREIVVLGKVKGNLNAADRVDIRNEGSLTGDVVAQRISIEDGAFFKGGIDIRKPGGQNGKAEKEEAARA